MEKIDRRYIGRIRYVLQWGLFALILYGGWRFYRFVEHFHGRGVQVDRPEIVEGFLPIGALMSLKVWIVEGVINSTHPAAMFIFVGALAVSALMMKSFCGWICPVGAVSELAYKIGARIFGRNFRMHRYLDYPLRSLKYLLLGFFAYIIVIRMPVEGLRAFMDAPYWKVADVKMLAFFTDMSTTSAIVIGLIVVLSLVYRNFWCRYLCPYGALTGVLGLLSPVKIRRFDEHCINCHKCSSHCPNLLDVESKVVVRSPECSGCMTCVSVCPAEGALDAALPGRARVRPVVYAAGVLLVFFGVILGARLTGHWESDVTYEQYQRLIPRSGQLDHP